nr:protein FAR-RED IMPAIRED RESPONSE 1-like [Aegilops tauschii subsp. strangulata]
MRFETFKEAKDFYNVYAKHAGFAVREGSKVNITVYLCCTCYGVYELKISNAKRQRNKTTARTNYKAKMRMKKEKDGTLVVKEICWEHNHRLVESKKNSRMGDVDDVLKTIIFFREMKEINKEFFCDLQLDESDRVKNIFWENTTFFAFALIRDEDADSFRWMFKTFLRCMRGKAPTCILTNQCPTMALATPDVSGNTVHKLCCWHIMKKYRELLAYMYNLHETFKDEFTTILNWPLMPTKFEAAWKALMDKYNLHDDATMVSMWNERERWILAYFKEIFCARMTSTQHSESMNYVLNKNYLHRFVSQVNTCVKSKRQKENKETMGNWKQQNTLTLYGFDTQMAKIYSRGVYSEIRKRLKLSILFTVTETDEPRKYLVRYNKPQKQFAWSQHAL